MSSPICVVPPHWRLATWSSDGMGRARSSISRGFPKLAWKLWENMSDKRYLRRMLAVLLTSVLLSKPAPFPVGATSPMPPLVTPLDGAVRLEWRGGSAALRALGAPAQPLIEIGGLRLPAALLALRVAGDAPLAPRIELLESAPWQGQLLAAERTARQTVDGQRRPDLAAAPTRELPPSPIVVLREGRMRGVRIVVLALSPVFAPDGAARTVTALQAVVPGAAPLNADATALLSTAGPFLAGAPGPANPAASGMAWTVHVAQAGIQRLPAAALVAAGVGLSDPALLHLYHDGVEVALEQRGSGANLELRFFASKPGDMWNAADTYW